MIAIPKLITMLEIIEEELIDRDKNFIADDVRNIINGLKILLNT